MGSLNGARYGQTEVRVNSKYLYGKPIPLIVIRVTQPEVGQIGSPLVSCVIRPWHIYVESEFSALTRFATLPADGQLPEMVISDVHNY